MESKSRKYCDIHEQFQSVEWCSLCEQALCVDCKEYHSQAKLTRNHKTISMVDFFKLSPFVQSLKRHCDEHDNKLNFYCPVHESLCCFHCIQSAHKQCDGVAQLHKVAENVKFSTSMEDLERNIQDITICMENLLLERSQNISNLDKQKVLSLTKIRDFKKEIIKYFDQLEYQTMTELANKVTEERSRIDKLRSKITREKVDIGRITNELNVIKQYASDTDTFISLQTLTRKINDKDLFLHSLEKETGFSTIEISFKKFDYKNALKQHVKSLGNIHVEYRQNKIKLRQRKKEQAQILLPERANLNVENGLENDSIFSGSVSAICPDIRPIQPHKELNFRVDSLLTIPGENVKITSCKILTKNQFVFLDNENQRTIFYGNGGNFIKRTDLPSKPYDITHISEYIMAVTLYSDNTVSLVDTYKGTHLRNLKTAGQCFGIVFAKGQFFICLPYQSAIQILNPENIMEMEYTVKTKHSAFNISYTEGKLVCSNMKTNTLFCISTAGELFWEYCHETSMEPSGLTTYLSGDIFVACRLKSSVIILSTDGTKIQELDQDILQLKTPRALDFSSSTGAFIVCDEHLAFAVLFKVI